MLRLDAAIAGLAAEQDGLATRAQLHELGLTDREITRRVAAGVLRAVHRGVFLHTAVPVTKRTRLRAALLACGPSAVLSHRSAAVLHRFDGIGRARPELTVCDTTKPKLADATVHRTDRLEPPDRCLVEGLPATSRARTLLDLGAVAPFEVVEHAAQVAIIEKLVSLRELVAVVDRLGGPGRRGTAALRAFLRHSVPDDRLASMLEHDLLELIGRAGVPMPQLQYRVVCADGRVVVLDFAWPEFAIAIEADGHRWHATRTQLEHDLARRRSIVASGWTHYAYGWGDVHGNAPVVIAEIQRSLSPFVPRGYGRRQRAG